jgi:hypothetical protein
MAKSTKPRPVAEAATAPEIAKILDSNGDNLEAIMQANEAMLAGMAELGREMMAFSNARLQQDMAASESLMCCSDAGEAFRLQCDFARTASEQYFVEADKLMKLANKMAEECWAPLESRTRTALDSVGKSPPKT